MAGQQAATTPPPTAAVGSGNTPPPLTMPGEGGRNGRGAEITFTPVQTLNTRDMMDQDVPWLRHNPGTLC